MRLPTSESDTESPNLTAVIDVVFFMLIYFLVATQMSREEVETSVKLAEISQAVPRTMSPPELTVNVTREGRYVVVGQALDDVQLAAVLKQAYAKNPGTQKVVIRADADTAWKRGVQVMGLCNAAGITDYRVEAVPASK